MIVLFSYSSSILVVRFKRPFDSELMYSHVVIYLFSIFFRLSWNDEYLFHIISRVTVLASSGSVSPFFTLHDLRCTLGRDASRCDILLRLDDTR